ncbi:MAG: cupin domain-containing protein [Planctomycetales bacterium]|nr:cupin domain-containing protein [Planctomycetales bacterium]
MSNLRNLFDRIPVDSCGEFLETLHVTSTARIERIVSHGHASPESFWYDQPRDEWVVVLAGAAKIEFEGEADLVEMKPGDYLLIPAHRRHRVAWTAAEEATVWLAVHLGTDDSDVG